MNQRNQMNSTELWIQSWNIFGAFKNINGFTYNKLEDPDFISYTKKVQILGLLETQHVAEDIDKLQIDGFKCFQVCRKKKKMGRKHGGIAVFVHNSIIKGVTKIPTQGSEVIVLRLDKIFFQLKKDSFLVFSYCSPSNSSYVTRTQLDPLTELERTLSNLGPNSNTIVLGDLNARTGHKLDYIENEDNLDLILPDEYLTDTYGNTVISLCRNVPLRICNGRKLGDTQGVFTCHKWNGQSVVDYCLSSPGIYNDILFLKVGDFLPTLSDHCSITIALKTRFIYSFKGQEKYDFLLKPQKLAWDKDIAVRFENIIQSNDSKLFLDNFAKNGIKADQIAIDNSTDFLTNFLVDAAVKASNNGLAITSKGVKRESCRNWKYKRKVNRKMIRPKWHDTSCESLNIEIKKTAALLKKYPNNPFLRSKIVSETKQYKKLVKSKHKMFVNNLFKDLDNLHNVNPKGYMNLVKSLRDGSFDRKAANDTGFIDPQTWRDHFSSLLGPQIDHNQDQQKLIDYVENNCDKYESELGRPFVLPELLKGISTLANNKATSFDRVSNEVLKTAKLVIARPTLQLFNSILSSGIYPSQWKRDILSPIHKSGEKNDPNNFRGVTVSSCYGKLFNKLLQKRLEDLCKEKKFISNVQGSGKAGSRTSDHLLIVKFLSEKYAKKKGKYLYTCFVDLRKAFDSVPRSNLFHSLLKDYSIGGKFLKILREIYKDNEIYVKLPDGLLKPFVTTTGRFKKNA